MEKKTIKVECPNCKNELNLVYKDGIEDISLKCPACPFTGPFRSYTIITPTIYNPITPVIGQLLVKSTGERYDLREGEFTVGRAAIKKEADIKLQVTDMMMSRIHLKMKVRKMNHNYLHSIMTAANKHPIFVNANELTKGEIFNLNYGDTIKMGSTYVMFVKPGEGEN